MKKVCVSFKASAIILMLLFAAGNSDAQKNFTANKIGETLNFPDDRNQTGAVIKDKNPEPSGVEAIGSGKYLLIADDKDLEENDKGTGLALKIVEASSGKVVKTLVETFAAEKRNPKWEALAKDTEGNYYVVGQHSEDRNASFEKLAAKSRLFRFRLSNEWETDPMNFAIDAASVIELNIKDSFTKDLNIYNESPVLNKVKIEGLAVSGRGCKKKLFIGLRDDPLTQDITRIYSGDLPVLETSSERKITLTPLFKFDAGTPTLIAGTIEHFKLSSLEYAENLKGFFILTSTENDQTNKFFGNALWFVGDETITAAPTDETDKFKKVSIKNILEFAPAMKAEGFALLPFADGKKMRAAIVFDNDWSKTKITGALEIFEITDVRK